MNTWKSIYTIRSFIITVVITITTHLVTKRFVMKLPHHDVVSGGYLRGQQVREGKGISGNKGVNPSDPTAGSRTGVWFQGPRTRGRGALVDVRCRLRLLNIDDVVRILGKGLLFKGQTTLCIVMPEGREITGIKQHNEKIGDMHMRSLLSATSDLLRHKQLHRVQCSSILSPKNLRSVPNVKHSPTTKRFCLPKILEPWIFKVILKINIIVCYGWRHNNYNNNKNK